ncbi:MAG TPA: hypothetical protein VLU46_16675, partial [Thermoanaerobaculia bacterium]|nr:hypothetical protein [Thermoanaerobaculia bacterium]
FLMRAGKVSREHVKQALAKRKENETLGDTLLNLGFITRKELTWARRVQVVGVIRSIGDWNGGSYAIVADYLPKRDEGTIFSLPQIIVELVVTDQARPKFEKLLESGSTVFRKAPGFDEQFVKLGFNEEADAVVREVDGERTTAEVAATSRHDAFNAYKLLHALSLLGLLERAKPALAAAAPLPVVQQPPDLGASGFEDIGVADAAEGWNAAPMPKFDLDDAPGQQTTPLGTSPPLSFDSEPEPESAPAAVAAAPASMPAWNSAPEPSAESAEEPQWGFDEAQIETARKASVPVAAISKPAAAPATAAPKRDYSASLSTARRPAPAKKALPKKKKRSYFGLTVALMVVFIFAGGAYYAFTLYTAKIAKAADIAVKRPTKAPVTTTHAAPPESKPALSVAPPPPAATPVTPKPQPRPPSPDRYAAMAREFAAAPNAKFTVQFEIVCEPSNITRALTTGGTNVWFIPISLKGRSCYRVFWGRYATRDAAERAAGDVPASLREAKPAVVQVPQP